jgi:hypothetical protein
MSDGAARCIFCRSPMPTGEMALTTAPFHFGATGWRCLPVGYTKSGPAFFCGECLGTAQWERQDAEQRGLI